MMSLFKKDPKLTQERPEMVNRRLSMATAGLAKRSELPVLHRTLNNNNSRQLFALPGRRHPLQNLTSLVRLAEATGMSEESRVRVVKA